MAKLTKNAIRDYNIAVRAKVAHIIKETGLDYQFNIGIDTSTYKNRCKRVGPTCESQPLLLIMQGVDNSEYCSKLNY